MTPASRRPSDADIYSELRDDLVRFATSLVGRNDAQDVVSIVMVRTMGRRSLSSLESPRAYLMKAVLNESPSMLRLRRPVLYESTTISDVSAEVIEVLELIARLPVRQRAAAHLFYVRELTTSEIAELMGVSVGTIKRYLFNARRYLRESLE